MDADDEATLSAARHAGLETVATKFKDDVFAAVAAARSFREGLGALPDATSEPWPPMRTRSHP